MKYSYYEYEAGHLSGSVAECHCVNRPSFFAEKNVSRRPSRPPNTPRGRHRAGRGRTERRRPRKRYPTCLLTDPRGRFRQLAARPRAVQTGSSANRRSGDSARECRVAVLLATSGACSAITICLEKRRARRQWRELTHADGGHQHCFVSNFASCPPTPSKREIITEIKRLIDG